MHLAIGDDSQSKCRRNAPLLIRQGARVLCFRRGIYDTYEYLEWLQVAYEMGVRLVPDFVPESPLF